MFGKTPYSDFLVLREEEGREREHPSSFLRSSEFRRLEFYEQRVKVHLLDEDYAYISKMGDFKEDPNEEIREIKDFGLGMLPTHTTTLQEVGILHALVYFHPKGLISRKI